ncbi:hypothetical protein [Magnetospirillum sp. 64-120]|uniref:hypothetical protein n=1 Tax=Magnetospirillum sp. 64-120 TaxID=1895778 RepID=UPI00092B0C7F|nr:hypothetical protein [Magnetospirillum sp. 64-120]OJX74828.1 MAG: hypothetical protein BGO92_14940 [Magnetospirillum sp. 64-120]
MAESHVVSALRHKRGEIAGEIIAAERRITDLRAALVHVDATLKLFAGSEANPEAIPPRLPKPTRALPAPSGRGDITRAVLDVLRQTDCSLSSADIAENVAQTLGIVLDTSARRQAFNEQIRNALYRQRDRGILVNVKDGLRVLWRVAD